MSLPPTSPRGRPFRSPPLRSEVIADGLGWQLVREGHSTIVRADSQAIAEAARDALLPPDLRTATPPPLQPNETRHLPAPACQRGDAHETWSCPIWGRVSEWR